MHPTLQRSGSYDRNARVAAVQRREYLTFRLGTECYGLDIHKVLEIRGYETPTPIANTPPFIKGVVNLRGLIVPIIDLRVKFNLPEVQYDKFTVVVILNVASRTVGIVVDAVSDVLALAADDIRPAPDFSSMTFDTRYIVGLSSVEEDLLILLDIEKLMTGAEMALLQDAAVVQV